MPEAQAQYQEQVSKVLTRLEELAPHIERTQRDVWMGRFRNLMAIVALVAFVLAGIALARIGEVNRVQSEDAARLAAQGRATAQCINNVLGVRSITTTQETNARKEYAIAQKKFAQGQTEAFRLIFQQSAKNQPLLIQAAQDGNLAQVLKKLSHQPQLGSKLLLKIETDFTAASNRFVAELNTIQTFRKKHPLGEC